MFATTWTPGVGTQTTTVIGTPTENMDVAAATTNAATAATDAVCLQSRFVWTWQSTVIPQAQPQRALYLAAPSPTAAAPSPTAAAPSPTAAAPSPTAAGDAADDAASDVHVDASDVDAGEAEDAQDSEDAPLPARSPAGAAAGERENERDVPERDVPERDVPETKSVSVQTKWRGETYARKSYLPPESAYEYKISGTERRYGNLATSNTLAYRIGRAPRKKTRRRPGGATHARANQRANLRHPSLSIPRPL